MKTIVSNKQSLKRNLIQLGIVFLISLVFAFAFCPQCFKAFDRAAVMVGWMFTIWVTQWYGHGMLVDMLDRRISWIEEPIKRALIGFISLVVYAMVAMAVVSGVFYGLLTGEFPGDYFEWITESLLIAALISFVMAVSMTAASFLRNWKESVEAEKELQAEVLGFQYEALKNQVNPHFLFNSFNVLSDIVHEDPKLAERFIHQLSKVYRYVLDSRDQELVPLEKELEFTRSFIFLLETRFEDGLRISIELEPQAHDHIIPMALQLLIENAVKHNEVSRSAPLSVRISREEGMLVVENEINHRREKVNSSAVGLENIRKRYAYFTDSTPTVEEKHGRFTVKLPIIKLDEVSDH